MIRVERYEAKWQPAWDDFIDRARNGVFLFRRGYMDYHADRFTDFSLLFFDEDRLAAVMPASVRDGIVSSHGGLTFGGVISDARMRTAVILGLFDALRDYLRSQGMARLIYKAVPHIYHRMPAEEDLYALYRVGARLVRRDVSSTIWTGEPAEPTKGRRWSLKRAKAHGLEVGESRDFRAFMALEEEHLRKKYDVRPTHTGDEMELLASRFPDNIRLFTAARAGRLLGGVLVYQSRRVAHAQYIAANDEGRELGCLDVVLDWLLRGVYAAMPYFDFGISTEQGGRHLNGGLIDNKESYGARAVTYDFYEWDVGH